MNYKAVFKLKDGIEGEMRITAQSDSDAFMATCRMFALQDSVEWRIDKMESIFNPKEEMKKALDNIERLEEQVNMEYDYAQDKLKALPEKLEGGYEHQRREELVDKLYEASEYLADVKKYLQESSVLIE
ncbi:MAG: hypothetical protein K2K85_03660 [Clostridia bacterium]|nr:hypothetical protein [Clostridia bacterium]